MTDQQTDLEKLDKFYSYENKKILANKISKIKDKELLHEIFNIIKNDSPLYTENSNGIFLFFHKLSLPTYKKLDDYLKLLKKKSKISYDESESYSFDFHTYSNEEGNANSLKLSNKERNLIKRKLYDKAIIDFNQTS